MPPPVKKARKENHESSAEEIASTSGQIGSTHPENDVPASQESVEVESTSDPSHSDSGESDDHASIGFDSSSSSSIPSFTDSPPNISDLHVILPMISPIPATPSPVDVLDVHPNNAINDQNRVLPEISITNESTTREPRLCSVCAGHYDEHEAHVCESHN